MKHYMTRFLLMRVLPVAIVMTLFLGGTALWLHAGCPGSTYSVLTQVCTPAAHGSYVCVPTWQYVKGCPR